MGESMLNREELELLRYYRGLPSREQFEILSRAEASFNDSLRMAVLAGRETERGENGFYSLPG